MGAASVPGDRFMSADKAIRGRGENRLRSRGVRTESARADPVVPRRSHSVRVAHPGAGDPGAGVAVRACLGDPRRCAHPRSFAAAVLDAAGGAGLGAGRAGHPVQGDRPRRSALCRWWAQHRGDEPGSSWSRVRAAPGGSGPGDDGHSGTGPGGVHLRPPPSGVLRERRLRHLLPGAVLIGGTPRAPFPSDQPGFDKVTMAAFFSAAGRQAQTSFHHSRIELYPGETDKLW